MRNLIELHEEVDEVNYFLKEWRRLYHTKQPIADIISKPEIRFVSNGLERVIKKADRMDVPLILKTGKSPVVARQDLHRIIKSRKHSNFLVPSRSTIRLTDYAKFETTDGKWLTYIGNNNTFMSLLALAEAVYQGGELGLSGIHKGDWSA